MFYAVSMSAYPEAFFFCYFKPIFFHLVSQLDRPALWFLSYDRTVAVRQRGLANSSLSFALLLQCYLCKMTNTKMQNTAAAKERTETQMGGKTVGMLGDWKWEERGECRGRTQQNVIHAVYRCVRWCRSSWLLCSLQKQPLPHYRRLVSNS